MRRRPFEQLGVQPYPMPEGVGASGAAQPVPSYPPSAAFSPTSVVGLVGWWDFSDITTLFTDTGRTTPVTTNGDPIKGVTDKSGTGKHMSEAASFPGYQTNIQNGLSAGGFNSKKLTSSAFTALNSPFTVFITCARRDTVRGSTADLFSAVGTFVPLISGTTGTGLWTFYDGTALPSAVTQDTAWLEIHGLFNGASSVLTMNGSVISSGDAGSLATSTTFQINGTTASQNYNVGDVLIYNAAVNTPDTAAVKLYLKTKWGTP